jgi:hypothetical protein
MLASRLRGLLYEIIGPTQSSFVPGRLITNNVLVAYECFHAIKKRGLFGAFYFLPHFTWYLYELPSFTFTSLFCHSLLYQFMICPLTG